MNDSSEIKLTDDSVLIIRAVGLTGVRDDVEVVFQRLGEHGFHEGDALRLGALTSEPGEEIEYVVWSYLINAVVPEPRHPGRRRNRNDFWMAIDELQRVVTEHLDSAMRDQELGFADSEWYYENRDRVLDRLKRIFDTWLNLSHRGLRDVDNELTLPTLWG